MDAARPPAHDAPQPTPRREARPQLLSIVAPVYNEQEVLGFFEDRVRTVCRQLQQPYELVLVNDGSKDGTLAVISELRGRNDHITLVNLSRNFGKEIALMAGLDHARGDAVVVIDADLQDPPELIGEMIEKWRKGFDVVYAQRERREGETWVKKLTAACFYRLIQNVGPVRIPKDTGDFRLISRKVLEALRTMREYHRFMKGLFAWVGFSSTSITYVRDARFAGTTKWNYWKLWNFSLEGITSFTTMPLHAATYLGATVAVLSFIYGTFFFIKTLLRSDPVQGFPTMIITVLFLGGVQLIALGLIGEYLGRVFNETKDRPLYFVDEVHWSKCADQAETPPESPAAVPADTPRIVRDVAERPDKWT
jgi:polyisoprenyl-phosphate glycosyltransferase